MCAQQIILRLGLQLSGGHTQIFQGLLRPYKLLALFLGRKALKSAFAIFIAHH